MSKLDEVLASISVEVARLNYELPDGPRDELKNGLKELFSELVRKEFDYEISSEELAELILIKIDSL